MPAKKSSSKVSSTSPASPVFDPVSRGAKPGIDHRKVFNERVAAITKDTKVAILHDTDADGLCSAIIVAKAVERMRGRPVDAVVYQAHKNVGIQKETIENLKKQKIDILFTVDKPIDEEPETVKEASLFFKIITFDHHQVREDMTDEMVLIIKAQFLSPLDGGKYPTAKMTWDLFSPLVDITDLDWVCSAGVIADSCYGTAWKPFVDSAMERHGVKITKDPFDSEFGMVARCIGSAILFDLRNAKKVFQVLSNATKPTDVTQSELREFDDKISGEIEYWITEHKKRAQFFPELELVFYVVSPKYPINSPLSTILSQKYYPDTTLVVVHDTGDPILGISLRRQDYKVHCPSLVRAATQGLKDANGGGHIPAAGGKIRREDLPRFLEQLKKEIASGAHTRVPSPDEARQVINRKE